MKKNNPPVPHEQLLAEIHTSRVSKYREAHEATATTKTANHTTPITFSKPQTTPPTTLRKKSN